MKRSITLEVDQAAFFDEVAKYGLHNSNCPIGSRVIACLLGGVDWREAMGLAVYGVHVTEPVARQAEGEAKAATPASQSPGMPSTHNLKDQSR